MIKTIAALSTASVIGAVLYFQPEPEPKVVTKIVTEEVEVIKVVTIPQIVFVEKPVLVKPLIRYEGPSYNFDSELINGVKFFEGYRANGR